MLEESIKEQVLNQISEKITLTNRELAWYAEKCRISLDKLQSKFVYLFLNTKYLNQKKK